MMNRATRDDERLPVENGAGNGAENSATLAEAAAQRLLIKVRMKDYIGRTDLYDLAIATCLELRREQGEFERLVRVTPNNTETQRADNRRRWKALLDQCARQEVELAAMCEAMPRGVEMRFWRTVEQLPLPRELAAE
jgi:hypothetical protein